ncbi:acyltransferase family protein [Clavibacter sp. km1a]|uniref:acyltransferase family protein n=1 Tax=Clavibacter sp. km1a TaxID=3459136 RepID=UPI004042D129
MTASTPRAAERHEWVDAAKGAAIVLVVLYHAIVFADEAGIPSRWSTIAATLSTFRMPLFFFAAGLFAAKALSWSLPVLLRRRLLRLLWIYVLWSALWLAVAALVPAADLGTGGSALLDLVLLPVRPNANTWFVYALAVYFAVAWLIRRLPVWAQLAPAVVLTVLLQTNALRSGDVTVDKVGMYLTFFLLAVHLGVRVLAVAPRVRAGHAVALALAYVVLTGIASVASLYYVPGVQLLLSVVAVAAGTAVAVVLARARWAHGLVALGSRTLPVYLLHFAPVLVLTALAAPIAEQLAPVALAVPPVLTVVAIAVSLLVHRVTRGIPGLYGLPRRLERWTQDAPVADAGRRRRPVAGATAP